MSDHETFLPTVIEDRSLDRRRDRSACGARPVLLRRCDLDEADLSGLTMSMWVFDACSLKCTKLVGARLEETRMDRLPGRIRRFHRRQPRPRP